MMPATRERKLPFDEQSRLDPIAAAQIRVHALQRQMSEEEFTQYAKEMIDAIAYREKQRAEWEADGTLEEHRIPGRISCLAGSCSFTVNWQGEMRPCVILSKPAVNVFETGFDAAWKQVREEVDMIQTSPECEVCAKRPLCRTCAAAGLLEAGDHMAVPKYLCDYTDETYRLMWEYLAAARS